MILQLLSLLHHPVFLLCNSLHPLLEFIIQLLQILPEAAVDLLQHQHLFLHYLAFISILLLQLPLDPHLLQQSLILLLAAAVNIVVLLQTLSQHITLLLQHFNLTPVYHHCFLLEIQWHYRLLLLLVCSIANMYWLTTVAEDFPTHRTID